MKKELEVMSAAKLGKLFPIIIQEHNPKWHDLYQSEITKIQETVGNEILRVNHIGSTYVSGLPAKPTIDILVEVQSNTDVNRLIQSIKGTGYRYTYQPDNPPPHMMFMKGYTEQGFEGQAYHLHVRYSGDWDELYFRDYLADHLDVAVEYGKLKYMLKQRFEHDREAYTQGKTEFIIKATKQARCEMGNRYLPR